MRGQIKARGENTWAIILYLGRGPDGKERRKWITFKGTKTEAEKERRRLTAANDAGSLVLPKKQTVAAYLNQWVAGLEVLGKRPKTIQTYRGLIKNSINPHIGAKELQKLNAREIKSLYAKLLTDGRTDGKGGLSAQSVKHVHRVLSEALKEAARLGEIDSNPCAKLIKADLPTVNPAERRPLTAEETTRLLSLAAGTRVYLPVLLAVATGMRRGEVLALRWHDVDLEAGVLQVRKQLSATTGRLAFAEPKSARGKRPIPLPGAAVDALRRHKGEQAAHRLRVGSLYQNHDLVVCLDDGNPWYPDGLTHAFRVFVDGTGLPRVRFHDLRHGHATQLISRQNDIKTVSERLGHSSIAITLDLYTHGDGEARKKAADSLNDLFPEAGTSEARHATR